MIGYVRGTVRHLLAEYCLVDVQGVGYRVFVSTTTRSKLALGKEATLFTYLSVREDAMLLYGFYTQGEYDLFLRLISVAGIGPKVAQGILSAISAEQLCLAIRQKRAAVLVKLPGVGKKTAERMILELYDKLAADEASVLPDDAADAPTGVPDAVAEAAQALAALGYAQGEYAPVLARVKGIETVEEIIKFALKEFARRA